MEQKIKIYADKSLWDTRVRRRLMMPIVRAHWDDLPQDERLKKYGSRLTNAQMVDSIQEADVCSLPMIWNFYVERGLVGKVKQFAEQAKTANKQVIVWAEGDFEKIIPIDNAILFQQGLYRSRSRQPKHAFEVPVFFEDYVEVYHNGEVPIRKKEDKPRVGFCGQAKGRLSSLVAWVAKGIYLRGLYLSNRSPDVPPPLLPPWRLRGKILQLLTKSSLVETNFIIRDRYRAGIRNAEGLGRWHPTNVEFVNNVFNTDYTVCIRGGGNFSKRLYETLCCGRIPIFVDTDSVLPYGFTVDWKRYCVWVDKSEVPFIAEKVADFHASLSAEDFADLQIQCRQLWQDRLSTQGFFNYFHEHFELVLGQRSMPSGH